MTPPSSISACLRPLAQRRAVGDLCLFYRYYFGKCSSELSGCVPPPLCLTSNRRSRLTDASHPYSVALSTSRSSIGQRSFFCRVGRLWNTVPSTAFPTDFDLQAFKSQVNQLRVSSVFFIIQWTPLNKSTDNKSSRLLHPLCLGTVFLHGNIRRLINPFCYQRDKS